MDKEQPAFWCWSQARCQEYGIGCFSKSAYDFVDWLKEAGQSYWQILPLGPTLVTWRSPPYQSFHSLRETRILSALQALVEEGVLTKEDCDKVSWGRRADSVVDYEKILQRLLTSSPQKPMKTVTSARTGLSKFVAENSWWLSDYALLWR